MPRARSPALKHPTESVALRRSSLRLPAIGACAGVGVGGRVEAVGGGGAVDVGEVGGEVGGKVDRVAVLNFRAARTQTRALDIVDIFNTSFRSAAQCTLVAPC